MKWLIPVLIVLSGLVWANADTENENAVPKSKVKYKAGKEMDFNAVTLEGGLKKPSVAIVTGNEKGLDNGLLRLREDFVDRMTVGFGEELQ